MEVGDTLHWNRLQMFVLSTVAAVENLYLCLFFEQTGKGVWVESTMWCWSSSWDHNHKHEWIRENFIGKGKSTSRCRWCERKFMLLNSNEDNFSFCEWLIYWYLFNTATCEQNLPRNPQFIFWLVVVFVCVCHEKICKTDKLTTYSALSMTWYEIWMYEDVLHAYVYVSKCI